MKKITELVTSPEKPEHKAKRKAITFGSFKRAEDRQVAERKQREHEAELAAIAEEARIQRALEEEEQKAIKDQNKRKRDKFITSSLSNAFGTKNEVDMTPVREQVIDRYLPKTALPEAEEYPTPFKDEPALNAELAEFKKKINEHLHTIGFASSGGGGIGSIADANDLVDGISDGEFIQYRASDGKFIGATASVSNLALTALDIDGGTDIGAAIVDADLFVVDDGAGGTNRKTAASRIKTYIADVTLTTAAQTNITSLGTLTALTVDNIAINGTNIGHTSDTDSIAIASDGVVTFSQAPVFPDGSIAVVDLDIDGGTDIGEALADGDLLIVDNGAGGTNRKTEVSRIKTYIADVTLTTAAQGNVTSLGTLTGLVIADGGNIGSASDTDAIAIDSSGNVTASQNLIVTGNFTVNGTTTTVNTANMKVEDTLLELNTGAGSNANDMGLIMERGSTGDNAIFMFDESADEFTVGTTTATNDATGNISVTAGTFTAATLKGNLVVADDGNIGSASDTDAIAIASDGVVTFSQVPVFPNNTVESADIQADAVTGAKIADDAIDSEHYVDGSIDTAHIADNQITPAKIAGEVNAQTGTSYTLVLADAFKTVTSSNGSAQTITIPPNSSVAFSVGDRIDIMMLGSGTTTVTGGSGVTLNGVSTGSGAISAQYVAVSCIKLATDTWVLMGNHGGVS